MKTTPKIDDFLTPGDAAEEYWFEEGCYIAELSNHAGDPLVSVARARVPAGGRTRWHRLDGITERYILLAGEGRVGIGNQPEFAVSAGDIVTIPPGTPQRIHNTGGCDLVFLAVCTPRFRHDAYTDCDDDATG